MKTLFFAFIVAAATLMSGLSAQAGYINGGFNAGGGTLSFNPGISGGGYNGYTGDVTFTAQSVSALQGNFSGGPAMTDATPTVFALSPTVAQTTLNINFGNYGSFIGNITPDPETGKLFNVSTNGYLVSYEGTFKPGSAFSGFDDTLGAVTLSFGRSTLGGSTTYSVSITVVTAGQPPPAVPEPASMAIFGLGALGFAARRFRRK